MTTIMDRQMIARKTRKLCIVRLKYMLGCCSN